MPIPLTVDGNTYQYPEEGDVGYAAQATGWAEGATNELADHETRLDALELRVAARAHISTPQTSIGSSPVVVVFDVEDLDTQSGYNPGTGVFTVPANCGGDYVVHASVVCTQVSSTGIQAIQILKNGTSQATQELPAVATGTANSALAVGCTLFGLVPGDTISVALAATAGTITTVANNASQISLRKF